jgi:hypothetical protein
VPVAVPGVEGARAPIRRRHQENEMAAAGRAGSALSVREQCGSEAARLVPLSDEQEAEVRRAIERPRRDDPCETERLTAFERDEELVAFPQPFKKARPRAAKRHAIALKER